MSLSPEQVAQKTTALLNSGQFSAAAKTARAGFRKYPRAGFLANMAGMALAQDGNTREAIGFFTKALKLLPGDEDVQNNLIQALVMSDQHRKAEELIAKLLPKRSDKAQLYHLRASSCARQGNPEGVIEATTLAVDTNPGMSLSYNLRGIAHTELGNNSDAVADFEKAHGTRPNDPDPLANAALPLSRLDRTDEALQVTEHALRLNPNHVNARHRHAVLLTELGRIDDAITEYKRVLDIDPYHAESFSELVLTQSPEDNAALEPAIRKAIDKIPRKSSLQGHINLAMGNLLFQQGEFERSGKHLATANAAIAAGRPYDRNAAKQEFDRITGLFPQGDVLPDTGDTQDPAPIFVIGQPRSGTTLTEMILTAHPGVHSCGELPNAGRIAPPIIEGTTDFDPGAFAAEFRDILPPLPAGQLAFVDKMPANYRFVGFLLHAFPRASIIHIDRDPRDVALSMWRSYFPSGWMNFTFDLKSMAFSANLYRRYMQHWESLYGDRILTMNYRDIVSDVEGASRRMAAHCGLEWTEDMAAPERNKARVRTASVVQVRQGVHKKSVGGWRAMKKHLQPFIDDLDPQLWPEIDPTQG